MPSLTIQRADLLEAFRQGADDGMAYLDSQTGAVLVVSADAWADVDADTLDAALAAISATPDLDDAERTQRSNAARVEFDADGRYLLIPQPESRDRYRDMQAFIATLGSTRLADQLDTEIQGDGAFKRFKEILTAHPAVEQAWQTFRDTRELQRLQAWLDEEAITPKWV